MQVCLFGEKTKKEKMDGSKLSLLMFVMFIIWVTNVLKRLSFVSEKVFFGGVDGKAVI